MRREIKFRIWDGKDINYSPSDEPGDLQVTLINDYFNDAQKDNHVMQYTGLFDDEGKEIYEGDIVEVTDGIRKHKSEVFIHPIGIHINAHQVIEEITGKGIELLYDYCDYGIGRGITQKCRVIGNKYENLELL